ncbi:MAG: BatA domain-containing protein, partial [Planctomycetes bacterium]|nr:BatA domain-containing protein [Planctomycetota bacterium]
MNFHIENIGMLFGLLALAVPIVLHLLQRRRYDTLDWGAMQFLPDTTAIQRRRWLDEILLMLLRMGMIALIVLALATPISTSPWLAPLGDRTSRDVVIIVDGSYSMDVRVPGQPTPWQQALRWTRDRIEQNSGERFTFLIARQPPHFAADFDELAGLTPTGNADMPRALADAWQHLQLSNAATKEIIILTDAQQHGWADVATLSALDNLGNQWRSDAAQARSDGLAIPSLRVVKLGGDLPKMLPNYSLAPLLSSPGVVKRGKEVKFQSALRLAGFTKYQPPRGVKVLLDGVELRKLSLPESADLTQGQIPLSFTHRFDKEGEHVVSVMVDADDALAADQVQHAVLDVVKELPVLLVDGDQERSAESAGYFVERALASKKAVPYPLLKASTILPDKAISIRPAVVVLADVPRLDAAQVDAIDRFLAEGGGLLIAVGERAAAERVHYNERLYRNGEGWLPAKLGDVASSKEGTTPEARTFAHPALELFRAGEGSMNAVRFPKWHQVKLGPGDRGTPIAMLASGDPFLIEKRHKQGRVLLCTVPLDRRWGATLPSTPEFPILIHELVNYLAGNRNASRTLRQGAPIRIPEIAATTRLTLRTPT